MVEQPIIMRPDVLAVGWSVMMTRTTRLYARTSALPAIAAALALSSTQALAQEATPQTQPVTTEPAPAATAQPAPVADEPAPATDASAAAPATSQSSARTTTRTVKHTTHIAAAKPATAAKPAVSRTVTTHAAVPAPASAPVAPVAPAAPAAPASQSKVAPVVDLSSKPTAPAQTAAAKPANTTDETLPIAAGGALALLALGAGAAAVARRRRRRREEQEWADQQTMAYEPFETVATPAPAAKPIVHEEQPAIVAPSAFAWGNQQAPTVEPMVEQEDRRPGESWVERAYRGPSQNNPSVSLKARLRRAAFFDKRERDVAAGKAEPVEADAGLPDALVEEQERELA
jgi:hypothetical protein